MRQEQAEFLAGALKAEMLELARKKPSPPHFQTSNELALGLLASESGSINGVAQDVLRRLAKKQNPLISLIEHIEISATHHGQHIPQRYSDSEATPQEERWGVQVRFPVSDLEDVDAVEKHESALYSLVADAAKNIRRNNQQGVEHYDGHAVFEAGKTELVRNEVIFEPFLRKRSLIR